MKSTKSYPSSKYGQLFVVSGSWEEIENCFWDLPAFTLLLDNFHNHDPGDFQLELLLLLFFVIFNLAYKFQLKITPELLKHIVKE